MTLPLAVVAGRRVRELKRYQPGLAATSNPAGKLSSNEAVYGPSPGTRRAVHRAAEALHRYEPPASLRERLAEALGANPEHVVVTNGSDELVGLIALLFLEQGDPVVIGSPCYPLDELSSRVNRGSLRLVPLRDGGHDLPAMARAAQDARVVWLPSPHNPTGVAVAPAELGRFLEDVPATCLVVLDEAYRDFTAPSLQPDVGELLARYPNLLVQRTFSKSYALAGMRVGFGIGAPELIEPLQLIAPPFNVNVVALRAAEAAIADVAWREWSVERIASQRESFNAWLDRQGVSYFPSQANFVTVDFGPMRDQVTQELLTRGIQVRPGADFGEPRWTRITIGAPVEMALVREAILACR